MANPELTKYSFVTIHGLKSEAGKKLNGAYGIVISSNVSEDSSGNTRYPIRIYAKTTKGSRHPKPIRSAEDKRIKAENLEVNAALAKKESFAEANQIACQNAQEGDTDDVVTMHWLVLI
ncbi:MAG: hypothetical protein SGARI_002436 [Bacillariaceae sp.]